MAENKMSHEAVGALPVAAAGALSVSELRAGMQQFLRSSGALGSLKTQLRGVIISELLRRKAVASPDNQSPVTGMDSSSIKNKKREDVEHTRTGRVTHKQKDNTYIATGAVGEYDNGGSDDDDDNDASWTQRLCDALVEDHLRHTSRTFSLAIFSSEADVSLGSAGDDGLAALLQFPTSHSSSSHSSSRLSLLQRIVTDHLRRAGDARGHPPRYAIGTQTDSADDGLSPPPMEQRLAAVDAKYALCFSRLGHSTREELERRMSAYRHDVHTQLEQSYQQRLRAFEEQRLREVRAEAEAQSAALLRHKLEEAREASRAASNRIEAEQERLRMAREDIAIARAELERRERDMQRVLDERDAATASMESRLDEARQQARLCKAQLQQCEELCAARLMELDAGRAREWRRGEDIRRAQAEHLAEIQLKDEEITRLRFRVRSMTAATAAAAATTSAAGVGGSGGDGGNVGSIEEAAMKAYDVQRRLQQLHEQQTLPHHEVYYPYTQPLSTYTQAPPQPQAEGPVKMEAAWQAAWQREVVGMRSSEAAQEQRVCETLSSQPQRRTEELRKGHSLYASEHVDAQAPRALGTSPQALPTQEEKYPRKDSSKDSSAKGDFHSNLRHSNSPHGEEQDHSGGIHEDHIHQGDDTGDRSDKTDGEKKSRESSASRSVVVVPLEEGPPPEPSRTSQRFSSATKSSPSSLPSSSSPSSSSSSSSPPRPTVVEVVELMGSATADESTARELIYGAEDVARRGIAWAAQSQRTVITAREEERRAAEEKAHNSDDSSASAAHEGRRVSAMDAYTAAAAQGPQFGAFIARDSDEESDGILFGKRNGSSDESF